jgi:hypothetical protein
MPSPRRPPAALPPPADLAVQIAELRDKSDNALWKLSRIEEAAVWLVVRDRHRRKGRPCPPPPPGGGWEPEGWDIGSAEAWKPE